MLDLDEKGYQTSNLMRNRQKDELLQTVDISKEKEILDLETEKSEFSHDLPLQNRKSLEFLKVKKWTSPRLRSVSSDRIEKSDEVVVPRCDPSDSPKVRIKHKILNSYGNVEGVKSGDWWSSRMECSYAGVHRPTFACIHAGRDGAYSIAISSCHKDGDDNGFHFTYTSSVGRDSRATKDNRNNLRITSQTRNQFAEGFNNSLIKSIESKNPVRVIRGYKLNSVFAPLRGYRYDGLYTVEKYWTFKGESGYSLFKFLLKRCADQPPASWELGFNHLEKQRASRKQSPLKFSRIMDASVNPYQSISSQNEESIKENEVVGFVDDNKENSTVNIADKILCDEFADSSVFLSSDILLPHSPKDVRRKNERSNKRKLPPENETKNNLKKLCERSVKNTKEVSPGMATPERNEPMEFFKGFSSEYCPRKMILLGFLIHDMQSKLMQNQSM